MPARGTQRPIYTGSRFLRRPGPPGARRGQAASRAAPSPRRSPSTKRGGAEAEPTKGQPRVGRRRPGPGRRLRLHTMARRKGSGPPLPAGPAAPRSAPLSRGRRAAAPARAALRPRRGLVPRPPRGRAGASRGRRRRGPGGG